MKFFSHIKQALYGPEPFPPDASTPSLGLTVEIQKALLHGGPSYTKETIKQALLDSMDKGEQPYRGEDFNRPWHSVPQNRAGTPGDSWRLMQLPYYARGRFNEFFDSKFEASFEKASRQIEVDPALMANDSSEKAEAIRTLILGERKNPSFYAYEFPNMRRSMSPESAAEKIESVSCEYLFAKILNMSLDNVSETPLSKLFSPSNFKDSLSSLGLVTFPRDDKEAIRKAMLENPHFGDVLKDFIKSQVSPSFEAQTKKQDSVGMKM